MVIALASHQFGPGSIPGPGVISGLSLLLVLVLAPRVFLRVFRFSGFAPPTKINISKFQFDHEFEGHGFVSRMTVMCNPRKNKVDLFIYLFKAGDSSCLKIQKTQIKMGVGLNAKRKLRYFKFLRPFVDGNACENRMNRLAHGLVLY